MKIPKLRPKSRELLRNIFSCFRPPPKLTLSQWSDRERYLSADTSAEPGKWKTSRFEPLRGMMDSITQNQRTAIMKAAQLGVTEGADLNPVGYYIDQDPSPILVVWPNVEPMAKDYSADRLAPMIRDTPCLRKKVSEEKSRSGKNTILNKTFVGGNVSITGANSPSGLRSKPKRVVIFEEIDGYELSSGKEGDPILLGTKRAANFWNRRLVYISTPTTKGLSRIEKLFEVSDKRYYHIPCPRCGEAHVLRWENIRWSNGDSSTARFVCPACLGEYSNAEKNYAVKFAKRILGIEPWIPSCPEKSPSPKNPNGIAGFHISELYSSWRSIQEIVHDWLEAQGDQEQLQVFINTVLGELWVEGGVAIDEHTLAKRCEPWPARVPERVLMLTAGVDTQPDRLEVEVVGWAGGEESWSIDYRVIEGNPDIEEGQPGSPWDKLTAYLRQAWDHPRYGKRTVEWTCIDSGGTGTNTTSVYKYVRRHKGDRIFAIKGRPGEGIPIISKPSKKGAGKKAKYNIDLYMVGVDVAKSIIYRRLRLDDPGPGYCHFPQGRELKYFEQLTAEKIVTTYIKGFPKRSFHCPSGKRNEALDARVYAFAALTLASVQWDRLAYRLRGNVGKLQIKKVQTATETENQPQSKIEEHQEQIEVVIVEDRRVQDPEGVAADIPMKKPRRRAGKINFINSWR